MKKLLIRSCLIAGLAWTASCSSNKETAPQEPAPAPAVQPEQTAAADPPRPLGSGPGETGHFSGGGERRVRAGTSRIAWRLPPRAAHPPAAGNPAV